MGKLEVSFGHHLHQITEAELVAQIPTHAEEDRLAIEVPSCNNSSMFRSLSIVSPRSQKTTLSDGISLFAPEPGTEKKTGMCCC